MDDRRPSPHSGPLASWATNFCHLSSQVAMANCFSGSDRALYLRGRGARVSLGRGGRGPRMLAGHHVPSPRAVTG